MALWKRTEGIGPNDAATPEGIARYPEHNPGLSWIAIENGEMVGTILCGHDGRRACSGSSFIPGPRPVHKIQPTYSMNYCA